MSNKTIVSEGTIKALYSDSDNCVCCEGNHRFGTRLMSNKDEIVDASREILSALSKLPDGAKIKITIEKVE